MTALVQLDTAVFVGTLQDKSKKRFDSCCTRERGGRSRRPYSAVLSAFASLLSSATYLEPEHGGAIMVGSDRIEEAVACRSEISGKQVPHVVQGERLAAVDL